MLSGWDGVERPDHVEGILVEGLERIMLMESQFGVERIMLRGSGFGWGREDHAVGMWVGAERIMLRGSVWAGG